MEPPDRAKSTAVGFGALLNSDRCINTTRVVCVNRLIATLHKLCTVRQCNYVMCYVTPRHYVTTVCKVGTSRPGTSLLVEAQGNASGNSIG